MTLSDALGLQGFLLLCFSAVAWLFVLVTGEFDFWAIKLVCVGLTALCFLSFLAAIWIGFLA